MRDGKLDIHSRCMRCYIVFYAMKGARVMLEMKKRSDKYHTFMWVAFAILRELVRLENRPRAV